MPRTTPTEYLAGALTLEMQFRSPVLDWHPENQDEAVAPSETTVRAVPARDRLTNFVHEEGQDYNGRLIETGYITAPKYADVMQCSHDTALRWLERFEEADVLRLHGTSTAKMYEFNDSYVDIRPAGSDQYKTEEEIVTTAKNLFSIINDA
jgi:hypothetical protein